jgi:hypothetical protein
MSVVATCAPLGEGLLHGSLSKRVLGERVAILAPIAWKKAGHRLPSDLMGSYRMRSTAVKSHEATFFEVLRGDPVRLDGSEDDVVLLLGVFG